MTTATMTTMEQWKGQWKEFYNKELENILNNEKISSKEKKNGVTFLTSVNENMNGVLADLYKIRCIFDVMSVEHIMAEGVKNLLNNDYSFQKGIYGDNNWGIIRKFDDNSQIHFDPFILEHEMMAEFVARTGNDNSYFLNIRIYEHDSERIDFDFEEPSIKIDFGFIQSSINSTR